MSGYQHYEFLVVDAKAQAAKAQAADSWATKQHVVIGLTFSADERGDAWWKDWDDEQAALKCVHLAVMALDPTGPATDAGSLAGRAP